MNKCLYCYEPLMDEAESYHKKCNLKFFGSEEAPRLNYTYSQMSSLAKEFLQRSIAVPGVQPKLSLTTIKESIDKGKTSRLTIVDALGGGYILKPPSEYYMQMPANESVTMHLAACVGIHTVAHNLIKLQSGELCYITKRIDRKADGNKIHLLDMFQITDAFDKYRSSYEKIGKSVLTYCQNTQLDVLHLWELCIFCYITGNNDMHLKNFSLIKMNSDWKLCPAYDLLNVQLANPGDTEELALTLAGKKKKITLEHFIEWGKSMMLTNKQMENSLSIYSINKAALKVIINKCFLSADYKEIYWQIVMDRYKRLGL